ncbi:MAG: DoxX family protein [Gemmatimonadota bacterium]|nr:MAG: DoxX family protein [Gemmatimonadota bacterium]
MRKGWAEYASLPLRLVLGFGFAFHGFPKLFSGQGHAMFTGMLESIGVPAAGLMSWVVGFVEFFGGLALIAGAFVAIVSLLGTVNMLVALFTVHVPHGFNFMNIQGMSESGPIFGMPGYEVNLLYIAGFAALALAGAGVWSVDRWLAEKRGGGAIAS